MAPPDWSQLHRDILQHISKTLNSEFYQIRFRSVCSSWRSSIPKNHHHHLNLPLKFPIPSDDDSNSNSNSNFHLSKRNVFLITPPPNQKQTLHPWLIKIGPDSKQQTHLWHPLSRDKKLPFHFHDVIDFNQHRVIHLGTEFVFGDLPSSLYRNNIEKIVVFDADTWHIGKGKVSYSVLLTIHVSGKLAICRCGDERWTVIPGMATPYDDVCVFNGRPFAVDSNGQTVAVGLDLSLEFVAEPVFGGNKKFLVESNGELLLVDKYMISVQHEGFLDDHGDGVGNYEIGFGRKRAVKFDVFRLDSMRKKWVEVRNLKDRVLVLGEGCAFSVLALDLGMKNGNCVIYKDEAFRHVHVTGLGVRVFCLDKHRISPLVDVPHYNKLFWPPPEWLKLRW
ncbi:F-box family protein [Trifolium pratense]|uniref:F-box family protein n=1 Tax=Trifolium pratense TaxID=57577 RepID=A0A2K3LN76_TRIPR|nr:F-box family protein [Trifolium pratense]